MGIRLITMQIYIRVYSRTRMRARTHARTCVYACAGRMQNRGELDIRGKSSVGVCVNTLHYFLIPDNYVRKTDTAC